MLMNMKSNSKVGKAITETASIAYTGELLPAGTASYSGIAIDATKRYLKNSGKDKTPALVESGQGKFFNGTNQYINTGATPNDSEGTFISRFTYASGAIQKIMAGMNYSNNRCYMGINASGKIGVGFGANTYDTLFSPDTLVAGRSYHVVFRYSGSTYWLFVDSVLKATGTITGLTTFAGTSFFIGALNNGGTASNHFNSVIDETYYYDVALTDAQIESLYKYPEKVKAYNGAIVPDIGNEDNCKLFLPMCENSGSNVVNVAVARGTTKNPNTSYYYNTTGGAITLGSYNSTDTFSFSQAGSATGNTYTPQCFYTNTNGLPTDTYIIKVTATVISGTCYFGDGGGGVVTPGARGVGTYEFYGIGKKSGSNRIGVNIDGMNYTTYSATFKIEYYAITAYPLVNYTTAMHTSAAKLSYGAQCTAWKRDSLGVLLGMSNGLSFDGAVSVKGIDTGVVLSYPEAYVIESIIFNNGAGDTWKKYFQDNGNLNLVQNLNNVKNQINGYIGGRHLGSYTITAGYHHVVLKCDGTNIEFFIDGVSKYTGTVATTTTNTVPMWIGSMFGGSGDAICTTNGTFKIHKGAEYAKFSIAKAWAKAQKTIAKLGA